MWRIVVGILLGTLGPLVLEHFMSAAPEWTWRTLSFFSLALAILFVTTSNVLFPYLRDYESHRLVSTTIISVAGAILIGGAWWFFFAWSPSQSKEVTTP